MKLKMLNTLVLLLLISCGSGKVPEPEIIYLNKTKVLNSWGMPFKTTEVNSSNATSVTKSVASVFYLSRAYGTGSFISEDGLFLTNHHIIANSKCMINSYCKGMNVVRDFSKEGAKERFTKVKLLAANESLDYALLQIEVNSSKDNSVPFVRIDEKYFEEEKYEQSNDLEVIGHPNTSSLRKSEAYIRRIDSSLLKIKSVTISGNSGSPVIDKSSDKLIALYFGGEWDKATIRTDGNIEHFGLAYRIDRILNDVRELYPKLSLNEDSGLVLGEFNEEVKEHPSLPASLQNILDGNFDFQAWMSSLSESAFSDSYFNDYLNSVMGNGDDAIISKSEIYDILFYTEEYEIFYNEKINISSENIEKFKKSLNLEEEKISFYLTGMLIRRGLLSENECFDIVMGQDYDIYFKMKEISNICMGMVSSENVDIIDYFNENFKNFYYSKDLSKSKVIKDYFTIILKQIDLRKGNLSEEQRAQTLKTLNFIKKEATLWKTYCDADYVETILGDPNFLKELYIK